ncbi:PAS domain S-box protein [Halomarina oriensis]|uniref:PAS domain S-box protein n=1 Tax=Halomarina oriensis TaxID=671145 RepID=A0A6B0GNK4_9EURY|nr:PAS domain S-box protein [Halomarina oriensis]MWG36382.1 PAS domain S-box protein [Halomarina oriensis]
MSDPSHQPRQCLYVGPSSDRFEQVRTLFRSLGVIDTYLHAESAEKARELVDDAVPRVVVTEFDLPERTGIEAITDAVDPPPDAVVVLLADRCDTALVERAYDAGVDEFVHYTGAEKLPVLERRLETRFEARRDADEYPHTPAHLDAVVNTASDAIVSVDEASVVRYANPAVEDVFGYRPSEVLGEPLTVLMPDEYGDRHRRRFEQYLRTGERTLDWDEVELPGAHSDGHRFPLSVSFTEFTVDGTRYFTGIMRDVTDRKRLQAERDLYHDATQRILGSDSFEDGLDTALDVVGSAMDWQYGEAWIRSESDPIERFGGEYVAGDAPARFDPLGTPSTFDPGEGLVGRVWASGEPEWIADVAADERFVRRDAARTAGMHAALGVPVVADGTVVAVLVFYLAEASGIDDGMVEATTSIAADLGQLMLRLKAESALRAERSLKDRVVETSPVAIAITDTEGNFEYLNGYARRLLFGSDAAGDGPDDVDVTVVRFDGSLVPGEVEPFRRVAEDAETIEGEAEVEIRGVTHWLTVSGAPLRDDDGAVSGGVFSFDDVTERKQREQRLELHDAVMDTVSDGVYALDGDGRFIAVNDAYTDLVGYDREELLGRPASDVVGSDVTDEARALQSEIREDGREEAALETVLTTKAGEQIPIEARISLFDLNDEPGRAGVVRDISERRRREERLAQLNEVGQALTGAETADEVGSIVVEGAAEILDLPLARVEYYDDERGQLVSGPQTPEIRSLVGTDPLFDSQWNLPWRVYAESDGRVVNDLRATDDVSTTDGRLGSVILVPLGTHGVFVAGTDEASEFSEDTVTTAEILAANAVAALDRVDRERQLRDKSAQLEEHNESLQRVNRLNDTIRGLTRELTDASTRDEIEAAVCAELLDSETYDMVWIGEQQAGADGVVARTAAGDETGYLDAVTDETGGVADALAAEALTTGEPSVLNNFHVDPPFESWQTQALQRGYRAGIAVPIRYRETVYGTLNMYTDEPGVFDEMETAVFSELGEMIGYAVNALERKKALVSEEAVEIVFGISDSSIPALEFTTDTGSTFEFESLIEQSSGGYRVFFSIDGADPQRVYEFVDRAPEIREVTLLSERDAGHYYEAHITESSFLARLVDYGAHPTAMTAEDGSGRLTVELPQSGEVRSFTRMVVDTYDGAELLSRTYRDRPVRTLAEFEANYRDRLTERQNEVLETAYFSGFFEWPRETSGQELAAMLGVSQPTVSRHVRTGERKLLSLLYDDS